MTDVLKILIAERDRLDRAIAILQVDAPAPRRGRPPGSTAKKAAKKPQGRRTRSPESLKRQSEKMKAYWTARRKAAKKASE